jgi:hypothetical protein
MHPESAADILPAHEIHQKTRNPSDIGSRDTNLKLAGFPARSPLPVAALPSVSPIPSAPLTNPHELTQTN